MIYQIDEYSFVTGESPQMQEIFALIQRVAPTDSTILISGETGVGKEIVARLIHHLSQRRNELFIPVNCTALSPQLIESELFGHEKGAFTGAETTRLGRFEVADKGTLLLDEISELDFKLQAKLLRALETKTFERVGSSFSKKTNVRIIATTNIDLLSLVRNKSFRADLFFRLNIIPIHVTPLRARRVDISPLIQHFLTKYCHKEQASLKTFNEEAMELLLNYSWPGNVRELSHLIERLVVLTPNLTIEPKDILSWLLPSNNTGEKIEDQIIGLTMDAVERAAILSNLKYFGGNRRRTAEALEIADRTLRYKLKKYNITNLRE